MIFEPGKFRDITSPTMEGPTRSMVKKTIGQINRNLLILRSQDPVTFHEFKISQSELSNKRDD